MCSPIPNDGRAGYADDLFLFQFDVSHLISFSAPSAALTLSGVGLGWVGLQSADLSSGRWVAVHNRSATGQGASGPSARAWAACDAIDSERILMYGGVGAPYALVVRRKSLAACMFTACNPCKWMPARVLRCNRTRSQSETKMISGCSI